MRMARVCLWIGTAGQWPHGSVPGARWFHSDVR